MKPIRVLLVDDDAADRAVVRWSLRSSVTDVELVEASSGAEGLAALNDAPVDCVLLDFRLSDMDGLEFIEAMVEKDAGAGNGEPLPVVMLTGSGNESVAVEAMKKGAVDYLHKRDLNPMDLQRAIGRAMDLAQSKAEGKRAEARYQDLFENANDLIQSVGQDGRVLFANRTWRDTLGYERHEVEALNMMDFIHPDSRGHCEAMFATLQNGEEVGLIETDFVTKDGRRVTVEGTVSCQLDKGQLVATRGIFRNITERKLVDNALRLRTAAVEAAVDGILICDAQVSTLPIIYASPSFFALSGYGEGDLLGRNPQFLAGPLTDPTVRAEIRLAAKNGSSFAGEILQYRKNGETFWCLLRIKPLWHTDGKLQYFVATYTDITSRRILEEALFHEREQLQTTLRSIGDGVITTDAQGRVDFMNSIAESLTGWQLDEAQSRPIEQVFQIFHEQTLEVVPNPVGFCMREDRIVELADRTVLVSRDGERYGIQDSAAPIRDNTGEIVGAVLVFQNVTDSRALQRRVEHQAGHDALTDLINRREFEVRLERVLASARNEGKRHALCFLDLDNFKIVNDTAGHIAGDALLKQVSHTLASKLRARDTVARLGGDEFCVLLENCPIERAQQIADDLVTTVRKIRFNWKSKIYTVGVSIGLVQITDQDTMAESIMSKADVACYEAKSQGRNRAIAYHADDGDSPRRHRELSQAANLRDALEQDRFQLFCQPIVPLVNSVSEPERFEVLLRMVGEDGQLELPGAFIPAAERYQLMPAIDRHVIREAMRHYASVFGVRSGVSMSINLSGNSLTDEGLFTYIANQLKANGVPADCVCFELTETAATANLERANALVGALKELGCQIALDDLGSGLSSFNYLKNFPVDYLKIDGSFVRDIPNCPVDRAMVESINNIGHVMGIRTVAEWVENEAIVHELEAMGVDFAQGYALGRPVPFAECRLNGCSVATPEAAPAD